MASQVRKQPAQVIWELTRNQCLQRIGALPQLSGTVLRISEVVTLCPKLAPQQLVGTNPTGEALVPFLGLLIFDLDKGMGWTTTMGRQSAYFHKVAE